LLATLLVASATVITQIDVSGEFLDPPEVLERVVRAEVGHEYVPEAAPATPAQGEATPPAQPQPGTQSRLRETLHTLGYESAFLVKSEPGGVRLSVVVHPIRRIRQVKVRPVFGRFPLYEEDILRMVSFRPGQPVPPPDELNARFEEQKVRIRNFLERQGYFDGQVEMSLKPRSRPEEVDLYIILYKGRSYAIDDGYPLVAFDPQSNTSVLSVGDIQGHFHHFWRRSTCLWLCGEFSRLTLRDDVAALIRRYQVLGYPGARVNTDFKDDTSLDHQRKKVRFTVNISTRKKLEVAFRGNHHIGDIELRKHLTFDEAGSYDSYECEHSASELHHAYQREGFYEAQVTWRREEPAPNLVRVTFQIQEGPERKVRAIDFVGNQSFSADTLREQIQTRVFPKIGVIGLGEGGYVTNRQLEQDEQKLTEYYQHHGFRQAKVQAEVATSREGLGDAGALAATLALGGGKGEGDLYVRFTIDEGPRQRLHAVDVSYKGDHETSRAEALRRLRMRPGQPLTAEVIKADREALLRWLRTSGYRGADVAVTARESEGGIDLGFVIAEGRKSRFGEILFRGNFHSAPRVIRRELPWSTGDVFDESKIDLADRNLRLLGLFTNVRISQLQAAAEPEVVHTVIQIEERYDDIGTVEGSGGWATDSGAFATLKYFNRNIFGWGKGIELSLTYGQFRKEASGTEIDPRTLGTRWRSELNIFARQEDTVRLGIINTFGGSATVSRELLPRLRLFFRYEARKINSAEPFLRPSGPLDDQDKLQVGTLTAGLGSGVDLDRRDSPLMPTRGFHVAASGFVASPKLDIFQESATFVKLNLTGTAHVPLGGGVVLYAGFRYDHGIPLAGDSLLPRVERFVAGGDTTVRGIEEDRLKTEVVPVAVPPLSGLPGYRLIAVGGNIRMLSKLELMFPLFGKATRFALQSALFVDTGIITNSFNGLELADFRHSAGIAPIRLSTPVGFLSLEYAWPLNPRVGDDPTGRVHVNVGFGF
jgi:outer membrane protein insertion porin family